jgi:ADP-ribose pyrophosphatase YjhB (NUDIX family)
MNQVDDLTIKGIRKKPGDNWGSGTILVNNQGQILVGIRTDTRTWATPGGKVDNGENVITGAMREVKEESGLTVNEKDMECYGVRVEAYNNKAGSGNNNKMWTSFLFICRRFTGEVTPQTSEMSGWVWMTLEEINKLDMFPPSRKGLDEAIKQGLVK